MSQRMTLNPHVKIGSSVAACWALLLLAGCVGRESGSDEATAPASLAGVKLRLVVVGDPAIATAVRQLQGEWNAQTGAEVEVEEKTEEDLASATSLPCDAVICPSCLLGPWAERRLLAPVPEKLLRGSSEWTDIFDLVRHREVTWGGETLAIPLGSPVLVCYYRADLLRRLGRQPPRTWKEYQELAAMLQKQQDGQRSGDKAKTPAAVPHGTAEPLGPGWAGLTLLARAAPYAQHRDNYSTLFDITTMEPLVAGPPFVRALEELVAAAKLGPPEQLQFDPAGTRAAFWQGRCGMAISWPTAASEQSSSVSGLAVGLAELPGSPQVYDLSSGTWEARGGEDAETQVPLLAASGRIGVVPASTEQQEAAFHLLVWLSGQQSARVCASSAATTLFRQSQAKSPQDWVEKPVPASVARAYAGLIQQTLRRQQGMAGPRIPGRAEYLAALDEAVRAAVRGEKSPADALGKAAGRWKKITEAFGVEQQKLAYLRSLSLE